MKRDKSYLTSSGRSNALTKSLSIRRLADSRERVMKTLTQSLKNNSKKTAVKALERMGLN